MPASKAHIKATTKWEAKAYDKILVRLKKGDKEKLKAIIGDQSLNDFFVKCVTERIKQG